MPSTGQLENKDVILITAYSKENPSEQLFLYNIGFIDFSNCVGDPKIFDFNPKSLEDNLCIFRRMTLQDAINDSRAQWIVETYRLGANTVYRLKNHYADSINDPNPYLTRCSQISVDSSTTQTCVQVDPMYNQNEGNFAFCAGTPEDAYADLYININGASMEIRSARATSGTNYISYLVARLKQPCVAQAIGNVAGARSVGAYFEDGLFGDEPEPEEKILNFYKVNKPKCCDGINQPIQENDNNTYTSPTWCYKWWKYNNDPIEYDCTQFDDSNGGGSGGSEYISVSDDCHWEDVPGSAGVCYPQCNPCKNCANDPYCKSLLPKKKQKLVCNTISCENRGLNDNSKGLSCFRDVLCDGINSNINFLEYTCPDGQDGCPSCTDYKGYANNACTQSYGTDDDGKFNLACPSTDTWVQCKRNENNILECDRDYYGQIQMSNEPEITPPDNEEPEPNEVDIIPWVLFGIAMFIAFILFLIIITFYVIKPRYLKSNIEKI